MPTNFRTVVIFLYKNQSKQNDTTGFWRYFCLCAKLTIRWISQCHTIVFSLKITSNLMNVLPLYYVSQSVSSKMA